MKQVVKASLVNIDQLHPIVLATGDLDNVPN